MSSESDGTPSFRLRRTPRHVEEWHGRCYLGFPKLHDMDATESTARREMQPGPGGKGGGYAESQERARPAQFSGSVDPAWIAHSQHSGSADEALERAAGTGS